MKTIMKLEDLTTIDKLVDFLAGGQAVKKLGERASGLFIIRATSAA